MSNEETRQRISTLIADMTETTSALRERGIDPAQRSDRNATHLVKRIVERAYLSGATEAEAT